MQLYLTVRPPSETLFKPEKFEKVAFAIKCERETFCRRRFMKRYSHNNRVIFLPEFSSNTSSVCLTSDVYVE